MGVALLLDLALVQKHHLVADLARKAHLVRHDDHGAAVFGHGPHNAQHLAHQLGVERGRGLVEQHHLGLHRQCAGDGHPLLLPARQMRRECVLAVVDADALQVAGGALQRLGLGQAQRMHRRFHHVLKRRHVSPQIEMLEHHGHLAAQALQLRRAFDFQCAVLAGHQFQLVAVQHDAPCVRLLQQVEAAQKGAFARAAGADHRDHVPGPGLDADALEHFVVAEAFVDVVGLQVNGWVHGAG